MMRVLYLQGPVLPGSHSIELSPFLSAVTLSL